MTMV
ncbi:hypothetical protein Anas_12193 [Armadillidium nasatum]